MSPFPLVPGGPWGRFYSHFAKRRLTYLDHEPDKFHHRFWTFRKKNRKEATLSREYSTTKDQAIRSKAYTLACTTWASKDPRIETSVLHFSNSRFIVTASSDTAISTDFATRHVQKFCQKFVQI